MSGTSEGAQKARETNLKKDPDYYRNIRQKRKTGGGGFKSNPELAKEAGKKGAEARWNNHRPEEDFTGDKQ